jgi:hypothetical protein
MRWALTIGIALLGFLARIVAAEDALDVYGKLINKTVLTPSTLPRMSASFIEELPADQGSAIKKIEGALAEQGVEAVQDGPHFVRVFRKEARDSLTNAPLRGAELAASKGPEAAAPGTVYFSGADLSQVLEFYGALSQRTILRPAALPAPTIRLKTRNRLTPQETTYAIATTLALNGICLVDDGAKFIQVVPILQRPAVTTGAPKPEPGAELLPAGAIDFAMLGLDLALNKYGSMAHRTILRPASLPMPLVELKSRGPLTRGEAFYAMAKVFELNGVGIVDDGTSFVQAVPLALRASNKARAPRPEPEARLLDPERVLSLGFSPDPGPPKKLERNAAQRLLGYYAELEAKAAVPEPRLEDASIWFHVTTPLSKSEMIYAIETTFALSGLAIIPVDDHSVRLGLRQPASGNNPPRVVGKLPTR